MLSLALVVIFLSFALSASAGMGGSIILIPALALMLGPKEAIVVGAFLLGSNNVFKILAYRKDVPIRASFSIIVLIALGSVAGASLMVTAPEKWVGTGIIVAIGLGLLFDGRMLSSYFRRVSSSAFALSAGITSGFSGTSGPMKGVALKSLGLQRMELVGAASVVSFVGDASKSLVFFGNSLFVDWNSTLILCSLPLMPVATWLGRYINVSMGEQAYRALFWLVMTGYSIRLLSTW